jgi:hypothetical protein
MAALVLAVQQLPLKGAVPMIRRNGAAYQGP